MTTNVVGPLVAKKAKTWKGKIAMDKQTAKLIARIAENLPEMDSDLMQSWIDNPRGLQKTLKESFCSPAKDEPLSTLIYVDRSIRSTYPDFVKLVKHPELEDTGPAEYDLSTIELWLHEGQKNGKVVKGEVIYQHLKDTDTLKDCLGLRDGEEIQKKGIEVFRKVFAGKAVFLWKSVVRDRVGNLRVPYFYGNGNQVTLYWRWLECAWHGDNPAARFAK